MTTNKNYIHDKIKSRSIQEMHVISYSVYNISFFSSSF